MTVFVLATCLVYSCGTQDGINNPQTPPYDASLGVVSSAHPLATESDLRILSQGGNAFDAAITVAATLNVVEPMMSGMGGYGTILIYDARKKRVRYLDSSGKIPLKTNSDLMRPPTPNFKQNRIGPKAVSTPGNVNAWHAMSVEYGLLDWEELFDIPMSFASKGFTIDSRLASFIGSAFNSFSTYTQGFYGNQDGPLGVGDTLYQTDLARTFELIAGNGPEVFYKGEIAHRIDQTMDQNEGFLSHDDLASDNAEWWEPIHLSFDEYIVFTASPPSTAFPSLIRLGFMQQFGHLGHNTTEYLHYFAEATKIAYMDRLRFAGDPEINPPPLDSLLSQDYFQGIVSTFHPDQVLAFEIPGNVITENQNTTHFVVADQWGNIVSATQTLGNLFGSRIMPEGTGIWLNNSLAYCTYEPKGNPMDAIPGQRKLSGDCPTIIFKDGKPWVALGTPGGHTIGQTVPQMVLNLIQHDMDLVAAINAPRISFVEPDWLAVEDAVSEMVFQELKMKGHNVRRVGRLGLAHALEIEYTEKGEVRAFTGVADHRGSGLAKTLKD